MPIYRLKLTPEKKVTVFGLQHKPTGQVLNPSLSLFILMKYPRLGSGKIVSLSASQLFLVINKYCES